MEKYLVALKPSNENPEAIRKRRKQWSRSLIELNGKLESKYRHSVSTLLMNSYSQVGAFPHSYLIDGVPCQTHVNAISNFNELASLRKHGISALDFDNKGIYLVTVTKSGCLTVHDFETLYCRRSELVACSEDEATKLVLHISKNRQLDSVKWNLYNQDEVVCSSMKSNELLIYDIGYISSEPSQVLRTRSPASLHSSSAHKGLSDIASSSNDDTRLFASDTTGVVNVWDRRMSSFPCLELATGSRCSLNSIQLNPENQVVFGANKDGVVHMWDLRGGKASDAFRSHKEICHSAFASLKLASVMEKIQPLKAQSDIVAKEIHSINLDPSCPYQLAFHLDDGWSGVLNTYTFDITHIHCPPPLWLNESSSVDPLGLRKPSWLPTNSIYVVGSSSEKGIYILDFYPDTTSPSHVDFNNEAENLAHDKFQNKRNCFVPSSEAVTSCAVHPLNGTIIAGTKDSSLLMISQRHDCTNHV